MAMYRVSVEERAHEHRVRVQELVYGLDVWPDVWPDAGRDSTA